MHENGLSFDEISEKLEDEKDVEKSMLKKKYRTEIDKLLKSILSDMQYKVYNFKKQGLSHLEIADKMGISIQTSKNYLRIANFKIDNFEKP